MSIVERALKKAQAKTPKPDAREASQATPAETIESISSTPADKRDNTSELQHGVQGGRLQSRGGIIDIDIESLRAQGRLAPEGLAHQTEEEFRRIKWRVLNSITGREGAAITANNVVLVTSAVPGEGKTFNALNLALSMAREADIAVLLVDGDVAQPALTACLGLAMKPGLTDLVSDPDVDIAQVTYQTNLERLQVMPAGARRDNSPELLASARTRAIIEELSLRTSPGVVIFDSPPILATNEAQVLSRYAGQVVMVVLADSTEQRVVTEALGLIDSTKPVSAVLNRVESSLVSRYYSHYYYGYGRGKAG